MKIKEISIKNCLSFSEQGINKDNKIELSDLNLFIGKNNSGKSNILKIINLIKTILFSISQLDDSKPDHLLDFRLKADRLEGDFRDFFYRQDLNRKIEVSFMLEIEQDDKMIVDFLNSPVKNTENPIVFMFRLDEKSYPKLIKICAVIEHKLKAFQMGLTRVEIENKHSAYKDKPVFDLEKQVLLSLVDSRWGDHEKVYDIDTVSEEWWKRNFPAVDVALRRFLNLVYQNYIDDLIIHIKPIRKIEAFKHNFEDPQYEEKGNIINTLDRLRDGRLLERNNFKTIKEFLQELVFQGEVYDSFEIIFPLKNSAVRELEIDVNGQILPLSHYGAGVEQLLSLATEIVQHGNNKLVLIEEPEVHFHPDLQRKFIDFLNKNKETFGHQYLITSHSSVFINKIIEARGKVFYVYSAQNKDKIKHSLVSELNAENIVQLFRDLSLRGSDLLQANGIIWVEGPSDRIYLEKWIELYCDKYKEQLNNYMPQEGKDYQIFYYGGSSLNYLQADMKGVIWQEKPEVLNSRINILRLNLNSIVIMDRDSYGSGSTDTKIQNANANKQRVLDFCIDNCLFCWMTAEQQIENYLPSSASCFYKGKLSKTYRKNKVHRAGEIVKKLDKILFNKLDLEEKLKEVVEVIKSWNK